MLIQASDVTGDARGATAWRVATASRATVLIDMADYYTAARAVMEKAERSIHLLGWAFDPDTLFEPGVDGGGPARERIGAFLRHLACNRREVDVRLLVWRSALAVSASQNFFPHRAKRAFQNTPVKFLLDASIPLGACHHQKMIVVDGRIAFCGGGDIAPDRWDTPRHLDDDPHRRSRTGKRFDARHEVMTLLDGPAASALGQMFADRWERATNEAIRTPATRAIRHAEPPPLPPEPDASAQDLWPANTGVDFRDVQVGVARTLPRWRSHPEVREVERLHLTAIAAAKRTIYMENQYFASPLIAEALAARLEEADGPEVVLVSTQHSPSWFDRLTMDRTRLAFLARLKAADAAGRAKSGNGPATKLAAFCPVTAKDRIIIVHAKLTVIDDTMLRIGSANINNRSMGFDTECDLALAAQPGEAGAATRTAIVKVRDHLLAHWLDVTPAAVTAETARVGSLGQAITALDAAPGRRLRPLEPKPIGPLATLIAAYHLGDPAGPRDSWAPWMRRAELRTQLDRLATDLEHAGLPAPGHVLKDETI